MPTYSTGSVSYLPLDKLRLSVGVTRYATGSPADLANSYHISLPNCNK